LRFILTSNCRAPGPRHRPDPKELLATGEAIKIKAGKEIAFRASKDLKKPSCRRRQLVLACTTPLRRGLLFRDAPRLNAHANGATLHA